MEQRQVRLDHQGEADVQPEQPTHLVARRLLPARRQEAALPKPAGGSERENEAEPRGHQSNRQQISESSQ